MFCFTCNDAKGLFTRDGVFIAQAFGFPRHAGDHTFIPVQMAAFLSRAQVFQLDRQWYAPLEEPVPAGRQKGEPGISVGQYLCHDRLPDENRYPILSLFFKGSLVHVLELRKKTLFFARFGQAVGLDISSIPETQRFTLTVEWSATYLELRATWMEGDGLAKYYSGDGVKAWDVEGYVNPHQGTCRQLVNRTSFACSLVEEKIFKEMQAHGHEAEPKAGEAKLTMEEVARHGVPLTTTHLANVLQEIAAVLHTKALPVDEEVLAYGLATEILRFFFGNTWTNENAILVYADVSSHHQKGRDFLKTEWASDDEQFRHRMRVITLAEIVYNMQSVVGLAQRVASMDKGDLESALGEMQCAALFAHPSLRFRFVNPVNVKGQDYEAEIVTCDGRTVCCEIKTKCEGTDLDQNTLWGTLEHARKQLPKTMPGIVVVRIPEQWPKRPDIETVVDAAVQKVFRQSQRLVAVLFHWEEWHRLPTGQWIALSKFRSYPNRKSRLLANDIEDALAKLGSNNNPYWVELSSFVNKYWVR